jgi:hypothetical protein
MISSTQAKPSNSALRTLFEAASGILSSESVSTVIRSIGFPSFVFSSLVSFLRIGLMVLQGPHHLKWLAPLFFTLRIVVMSNSLGVEIYQHQPIFLGYAILESLSGAKSEMGFI